MPLESERARVAHLLRRAGFGATQAELDEYAALGFQGTLDRLLAPESVDDSALEVRIADLTPRPDDPDARKKIEPAKFLWFSRMLYTRRPLLEKLALFWHGHFATANSKVRDALLMLGQIQLFRTDGLGSFETLLQRVTRDPAMLIWLDNRQNRKSGPNENYAREVMEMFTVGIGQYTEQDVKEAARAFTGYTLDKNKAFVFNRQTHDAGDKTFLGETGAFDADDILHRLVNHPATARSISTKLFTYFVHDDPEPATVDRLAATFTGSGFEVRAVLRDLFSGPEFLSPRAFHAVVKQPADFVVGSLKALEVQNVGPDVTQALRRMGQDLLNPPNVGGWVGGQAWINATTLFERFNFANKLATARDDARPYFTDVPGPLRARGLQTAEAMVDYYAGVLLDGDLTPEARQALVAYLDPDGRFAPTDQAIDRKVRGLVHLALSTPTYQLA